MRNRKRAFGVWSPLAMIVTAVSYGLYGNTPEGGGAAAPAAPPAPTPAAPAAPAPAGGEEKPLPYEDARRLMQERDRSKAVNRAITEALGLEVSFEEDAANPGKQKPVVKGLDELKTLRQQQSQQTE